MEIFEKSLGMYVDDKLSLSQLLLKTMSWKTGLRYPRNIHPRTGSGADYRQWHPMHEGCFPIIIAKFAEHFPLYHQESICGRAGLTIPRSI